MLITVPRLLGLVAALQASYLGIAALLYFAGMEPDEPVGEILWRAFWPVALACGAYVLWLPRPPRSFYEALIRTIFVFLVIAANIYFVFLLVS